MSFLQLLALLGVAVLFWYWLDAMRIKEAAHRIGKRECEKAALFFLDDTVALSRVRLRRDREGYMRIFREYRFEFTSDGSRRYTGEISMQGRHLARLWLEPFRIPTDAGDSE